VRFRSFQSRILTFFLGLFVLVQAAAFYAVNAAHTRNARRQIDDALEVGAGVFHRLIEERNRRLLEAARLLSGDFAFKAAYATSEAATILSALRNHRARIGADVMILASLDYEVTADTRRPAGRGARLEFAGVIEEAVERGDWEVTSIVFLEERPYQMVVVPLLTPVPDAWICVGFLVERPFAEELRKLTLSHVSLLNAGPGGGWAPFASTLEEPLARGLPGSLALAAIQEDRSTEVILDGERHVALLTPLGGAGGRVVAVLQRPLAEALAPYLRLRIVLAALFSAGVALTLAAGILIARTVTRPVLDLAAAARKVEEGDYSRRLAVRQEDEIGKLAASFNHMAQGLEERARVRDLLGKVVSPEIAQQLLSKGIELGGEEREVTILFADVRDFTAFCEGRPARQVLSLLNAYLTRVSGVVEANGGVVDKYIGDAVMALFGAPLGRSDDAARAVDTALRMCGALADLNNEFRRQGLPTLRIGVGVNTAEVVAGNMGSATRLNYTVIGDGVNVASRLEGLTKAYGAPVLVSERTKEAAPGFVFREVDRVRVKGKTETLAVFEPVGRAGEVPARLAREVEAHHAALAAFRRQDWAAARGAFLELRRASPDVPLYGIYLDRIEACLANPPGPDWDYAVSHAKK
jgi:adenylate cyclase